MIEVVRAAVACSIQDLGRHGHMHEGHARSGAMDPASLEAANRLAGAGAGAAAIEIGPGPFSFRVGAPGIIAFGGAPRRGAPWWETLEVSQGDSFELPAPEDGLWSYLAIAGGVEVALEAGSRSAHVREGIGSWLEAGSVIHPGADRAEPAQAQAAPMSGPVRVFGELPGAWRVSTKIDRMGYRLEGKPLPPAPAGEWSEPVLPGFVQLLPSGLPIVLMTEAPTVGGYHVPAVVHSEDLRLVAQTPPGRSIEFVPGFAAPA